MGWRHLRGRYQRVPRPELVRPLRQSPHRATEGHRALHDDRPRSHPVRSDHRRSGRVHAALEDEYATLSPGRGRRAARAVQVCRVRRGTDVRAVSQGAHPMTRVLAYGTTALALALAATFLVPDITSAGEQAPA